MVRASFGLAAVAILFFLELVSFAGDASAQQPAPSAPPDPATNPKFYLTMFTKPYCTPSDFPGYCVKALKIYNDTGKTIYPVIQGSLQQAGAVGCANGDFWLQAAFGDKSNCYGSTFTYHVYVNGTQGIPNGQYATVDLPFWSQRIMDASPNPDKYIDWWRGGRLYVFDDQNAVEAGYHLDQRFPLMYAGGSPKVICDASNPGACTSTSAFVSCALANPDQPNSCVPGSNAIADATPQQLNEYTFGDANLKLGLIDFNVNYNVSNVDQVYLPVAIEPIVYNPQTPTVGYLGSILGVVTYRKRLGLFTGAGYPPTNPTNWPIYKVQLDNMNKPLYPNAGIRVPGANVTFLNLASPAGSDLNFPTGGTCVAPGCNPGPSNGPTYTGATLVDGMISQWLACVQSQSASCPQYRLYLDVDAAFRVSYQKCYNSATNLPPYLQPAAGNSVYPNPPGYPNLYAYLQFVYGWVPFNAGCPQIDLPVGQLPREYITLQDNFQQIRGQGPFTGQQRFNPYAQLIHGSPNSTNSKNPSVPFGLESVAYAYSIDDQSSFLNLGALGLIVDIGGSTDLPNKTPYIFPPPADPSTDIQINLGSTVPQNRPAWVAYKICGGPNDPPTQIFPANPPSPNGDQTFWVPTDDPTIFKTPCYVTVSDASSHVYQIQVLKPVPWPNYTPPQQPVIKFDPTVMTCPKPANSIPGYITVPSDPTNPNILGNWCGQINELSIQQGSTGPNNTPGPQFILSTPPSNAPNN
jgi:hypothetical protein